jgi:hypothetical protein
MRKQHSFTPTAPDRLESRAVLSTFTFRPTPLSPPSPVHSSPFVAISYTLPRSGGIYALRGLSPFSTAFNNFTAAFGVGNGFNAGFGVTTPVTPATTVTPSVAAHAATSAAPASSPLTPGSPYLMFLSHPNTVSTDPFVRNGMFHFKVNGSYNVID